MYSASDQQLLSQSTELASIIAKVVSFEAVTELTFDYLKVIAPSEREKQFLQAILNDERKHFQQLKLMYYWLTGRQAAGGGPIFKKPMSFYQGVDQLFLQKLELFYTYKKIRQLSPIGQFREIITEFIDDELCHLPMLNHLLLIKESDGDARDH